MFDLFQREWQYIIVCFSVSLKLLKMWCNVQIHQYKGHIPVFLPYVQITETEWLCSHLRCIQCCFSWSATWLSVSPLYILLKGCEWSRGQHGKTTYTECIQTDLDSRIQLAEVHVVCLFIHARTLIMYFAQELSDSGVLNGIPFVSTACSGHLYKIENAPLFHPYLNTCGSHLVQVIVRMQNAWRCEGSTNRCQRGFI